MPFRFPSIQNPSTIECGQPVAVTLGSGKVETQGLTPKSSNRQSIAGLYVTLSASVTNSEAVTWRVSDLFGGLKVTKGGSSNVRLNIESKDQLFKVYHALTRSTNADQRHFYDPEIVCTAAGQSFGVMRFFLPIELKTRDSIPQFVFSFNGVANSSSPPLRSITAGTVTTNITYYYTVNDVLDDQIDIIKTPTTLNRATAIDVSTYFAGSTVYDEVWMDVIHDSNMDTTTFRHGDTPVYPDLDAMQLRAYTTPAPFHIPIDGFYMMKTPPKASFPANGVSTSKPILDVVFNTEVTPTFYLFSKI
jgi:hypothetical protein